MKQLITSDKIPALDLPFSPALRAGDFIFLAGQGGHDPATRELAGDDVQAQTDQALRNVSALLEAAGATLDDVVSVLVHLVDLDDFPAYNAAYEKHFPGVKPVRTTVRADLVSGMRVEITVTAYRPG
jgi:2-iminobutanoate/2-iminopropanoate deaminase